MDINKQNVPILIIVICASITMLVQTISSAATVMGYDKVIEADATARANAILSRENTSGGISEQLNAQEEYTAGLEITIAVMQKDIAELKSKSHHKSTK